MKIFLLLLAATPILAQGPNTVLIGSEGIVVSSVSSPATFVFGAGTTWNTITAAKFPLVVNCSSACPQLGGDPAQGVTKSLYAQQQATAYTVTLSTGAKKTVPALPPSTTTYTVTCTGTLNSTTLAISNSTCTAVKK